MAEKLNIDALKKALEGATPGPWQVGNRYTGNSVWTETGDLVAGTHGSQRNYDREEQLAEQDANAAFIAMAPAMAEALVKAQELAEKVHTANVKCSIPTDAKTVTMDTPDWVAVLRSARAFLECVEGGE